MLLQYLGYFLLRLYLAREGSPMNKRIAKHTCQKAIFFKMSNFEIFRSCFLRKPKSLKHTMKSTSQRQRIVVLSFTSIQIRHHATMPPPKDAKIWNEDLVNALRAREDVARRAGKRDVTSWRRGAETIEGVRKNIYTVSTALPTY